MSNKKIETLYAELDVLLDTRMGTLARLSKVAAMGALDSGYLTRKSDNFAGVDMEAYRRLYENRNVETLKYSVITGGIDLIAHLVSVLKEQAIVRPYHDDVALVINTYPYELSDDELSEFGRVIVTLIHGRTTVEFVHLTPAELTPTFIQNRFSMMIVYDINSWMNLHTENLAKTPIDKVIVFAPAIYFAAEPSDEEIASAIKTATHPLTAYELFASPLVGVQLIDVKHFSVIDPKTYGTKPPTT